MKSCNVRRTHRESGGFYNTEYGRCEDGRSGIIGKSGCHGNMIRFGNEPREIKGLRG